MINTNLLDIDNQFFKHVRTKLDYEFDLDSQVERDVYRHVYWGVHLIWFWHPIWVRRKVFR